MKRGQVTQFIIAGLIILILLISGNVNADMRKCDKAVDLAEQGAKNNILGYSKTAKPEPQAILPQKLKSEKFSTILDDSGKNFNIEYLKEKKSIITIQSIIGEKEDKIIVDLKYIRVAPAYRGGGTGTELFNNFKANIKFRNNMANGILRGQADDLSILNYWGSLGAK